MNKAKEYNISNKWIWAASIIPLSALPVLLEKIEISSFSIFDWVMFVVVFASIPVAALVYRSKVVVNDNAFEVHRGLFGVFWIARSKQQKYKEIIPPEQNQDGFLSFVCENGGKSTFDPVKNWKDVFIRRSK